MTHIEKCITKGLDFLAEAQAPDGSFTGLSSPHQSDFTKAATYQTTFTPALILSCLNNVKDSGKISDGLVDWLVEQRSPTWAFNYWSKHAPERQTMPYPDDLDDTFCALQAVYQHKNNPIDGKVLAQIVKLLVATEEKPGGPYRTWLVPKASDKAWLDVDLAVNANVASFINEVSNPLPNLTKLMDEAITANSFKSPYYPNELPIIYYIARAYTGQHKNKLVKIILDKQKTKDWWGSPLKTALALSALARLGYEQASVDKLLKAQSSDGSWPAEAFCLDPAIKGKKFYSGSQALTTAFVLESVSLVNKPKQDNSESPKKTHTELTREIYEQVVSQVMDRFDTVDQDVRRSAINMFQNVVAKGAGQDIVLLPYYFYKSLNNRPRLPKELFVSLGLANVYGWLAYTIYDDFLDDEGDPKFLSAANVALRSSVKSFKDALPDNPVFHQLVEATFDRIDSANAWEVNHCRFTIKAGSITLGKLPRYGTLKRLAERSCGHGLTPVAVLVAAGEPVNGVPVIATKQAFDKYLIARQLNDDLHDWEEDVRRGHITYVVAEVLKDLPSTPKTRSLERLVPVMRKRLWHHTLPKVCQTITKNTGEGLKILTPNNLLATPNVIQNLLAKTESVNKETLKTVSQAEEFLTSYKGIK